MTSPTDPSDLELVIPEEDLALLPEEVRERWGYAIHQYSLGAGSQSLKVVFDALIASQKELAAARERVGEFEALLNHETNYETDPINQPENIR